MATESSKLAPIIATAAKKFATARDIDTVGDLLALWPRRYRTRESDLGSVTPGEFLVGVAEVKTATTRSSMKARKGTMLNVVITDGTHDIDITFFKAWGHEKALRAGRPGHLRRSRRHYNNRLQLTHPGYTMLDDFDAGDRKDLIPIYRAVGSLHTWTVTESVRRVLDVLDEVPDPLPADVRAARGLLVAHRRAARHPHPELVGGGRAGPARGCGSRRRSSSR